MSRPAVTAALVLTSLVAGWTVLHVSRDASAVAAEEYRPALPPTNRSKPIGISQPVLRERWGSDPRAAGVAAMRMDYERTGDLRAFFDRALQDPRRAGFYYAKRALADCWLLIPASRRPLDQGGSFDDGRHRLDVTADMEDAVSRCHGLGDADDSGKRLLAAIRSTARQEDPALSLWTPMVGSFDQSVAMLRRAFDLGDPYYFLDAFVRTTIRAGFFDGEPLDEREAYWLRRAATVAHCDLGADCDHHPTTVATCFETGTCRPFVIRLVQDDDVPPGMRTALVRIAAEMANASRDGSLAARFSAPASAPAAAAH